jgi:hypothetical protein
MAEIAREMKRKKKKKSINDDKAGASKLNDPPEAIGVNTEDDEGAKATKQKKKKTKINDDKDVSSTLKDPPEAIGVTTEDDEGAGEMNKKKKKKKINHDKYGSSKLKDPPEAIGVNTENDEGAMVTKPKKKKKKKAPPEAIGMNTDDIEGAVNALDEAGGERIKKDYQMAGVDDHVEYSMAPPMDDGICPPLADVIGDQWNVSRKKIVFGGIPYTCNKVIGDNTKKGNTITKYYCCGMVLFNGVGEKWKPLQLPKNITNIKPDTTLTKCKGTLHGTYTMVRGVMKYSFRPGNNCHICHNPTWVNGNTLDIREPLVLIVPSVHWNITDALLQSVKQSLESIKSGWAPLGKCGTARQYLPELSSSKSMTIVRDQVTSILSPFLKKYVTTRYPTLIHYKVGAIRSRGDSSQEELTGTLHRDFSDDTNARIPEERPQSIIVALDPFNFLYEHNRGCGQLETLQMHVPSGHGIVFTSTLNHAGGANVCADAEDKSKYVYRLFAYIVSDRSHYPAETGIRITIPDVPNKDNEKTIDFGQSDDMTNVRGHTIKGRQLIAMKRFVP